MGAEMCIRDSIKSLLLDGTDDADLAVFRELALGKRPEYELYDLRSDPWQVSNVSGHRAYRRVERELKSSVIRWMKQTDDPRSIHLKTEVFDRYEYFGGAAK